MLCNYELALILSAKLAEDKHEKILAEVKKVITDAAGTAEEAKLHGKKAFTYPIKRETEGFYYILKFALGAKEAVVFNKKLTLNSEILRYLLIRRK